jgi:arylsulfatase A-like enzyme
VISLDIFGTAAILAGRPIPKNRPIDGVNLMPFLTGKKKSRPHDVLFWRLGSRTAIRSGDWKLLRNPRRGGDADWQLYDLAKDSNETNNLAKINPAKLKELMTQWKRLNAEMRDPIWSPKR